jgi:hypothetical protein
MCGDIEKWAIVVQNSSIGHEISPGLLSNYLLLRKIITEGRRERVNKNAPFRGVGEVVQSVNMVSFGSGCTNAQGGILGSHGGHRTERDTN